MQRLDGRSRRIVYVAHCILNQNSLVAGLASPNVFPSLVNPVVDTLLKYNTGIVQMPCPERELFGINRMPLSKADVAKEDIEEYMTKSINKLISEIEDYINNEYKVLAVIGKRGSPFCGVHKTFASKGNLIDGQGFWMERLSEAFKERNWDIPFISFNTHEPMKSLDELMKTLDR